MATKKTIDPIDFDFGFTIVDDDELETVQEAKTNAEVLQERLDKLYNSVQPLLINLKKDPEKTSIKWPNRVEKVKQFEEHIRKIYNGEV